MDELMARIAFAISRMGTGERLEVHHWPTGTAGLDYDEYLHTTEAIYVVYVAMGDTSEAVWRNPITQEIEFCG